MNWQPPPNHPITLERARELARGELGDVYRNILRAACLPIYWFDLDDQDARILHNGTLTLVDTGPHVLGITAEHVVDLSKRQRDQTSPLPANGCCG
jgi:hypothetical protein